jgi:putative restriction endonuclease
MSDADRDDALRRQAMLALDGLVRRRGVVLTWADIDRGFAFAGEQVKFANRARGIFRPRQLRGAPLSIKTTVARHGRVARYDDVASPEGFFRYRFQGDDARAPDNVMLRVALEKQVPLIYFFGIEPGTYCPLWPAYVSHFSPETLSCEVMIADARAARSSDLVVADGAAQLIERGYTTVEAKRRLHQAAFRERVLAAYEDRCAVCRFPERVLLEAAHILPDRDERGTPEVPNGLSLCQLHHGAFDAELLGIDPDGGIHVAERIFALHDGATLEQGLKAFRGSRLHLPASVALRPSRAFLAERFEQFRRTA